jgi:hypothetical protein
VTVAAALGYTVDTDSVSDAGALVLTKTELELRSDDRDDLMADRQGVA